VVLVFAAGYGIYLLRKRKKEKSYLKGVSTKAVTKAASTASSTGFCKSRDYPLEYGTCHKDVEVLQRYLKVRYKANLGTYGKNKDGIDGMFGGATKNAALAHLKRTSFSRADIAKMMVYLGTIKLTT